jgi:hypothetical protein
MTENEEPSAEGAPALHPTPLPPQEDLLIDEESDESFPASDPPSYPGASASRSREQDQPPPDDAGGAG